MLIYVIITNKESDEMKQLNIEVVLINNNQISKGKYFAIKDDNSISYIDNNVKVYLYFKDMVRITRENDEYFLDFNFVKDQVTKGKYILKNLDKTIDLDVLTNYIVVEDNLLIIKYKVLTTEQDVIFKLKM